MKNAVFILLIMLAVSAKAQINWALDNAHSSIKFEVTHMAITSVDGDFKKFTANITTAEDNFNDAKIECTIDANSVNTENEHRDEHFKSDDFFNTEKYPNITFKSTSFKKTEGKKYVLEGDMTIKDVTKRVKFDVVYNGNMKDKKGDTHAGFKATTTINRLDYNLKWNSMIEATPVVSNDVTITVNIEVKKQDAAKQ